MDEKTIHSTYKGYTIVKVTQPSGRVTYDIQDGAGFPVEWAHERLSVARATINAIVEK